MKGSYVGGDTSLAFSPISEIIHQRLTNRNFLSPRLRRVYRDNDVAGLYQKHVIMFGVSSTNHLYHQVVFTSVRYHRLETQFSSVFTVCMVRKVCLYRHTKSNNENHNNLVNTTVILTCKWSQQLKQEFFDAHETFLVLGTAIPLVMVLYCTYQICESVLCLPICVEFVSLFHVHIQSALRICIHHNN